MKAMESDSSFRNRIKRYKSGKVLDYYVSWYVDTATGEELDEIAAKIGLKRISEYR